MKKEATLYARPKVTLPLIILLIITLLAAGFFLFRGVSEKKAYDEFIESVPAAAEVDDLGFYLTSDGSIVFQAPNLYSFAVLSDQSSASSLLPYTVGGNTINAVFMPAATKELNDVVLSAIASGIDIRNLYVPRETDKSFLTSLQEKAPRCNVIVCTGGEYQLFKDAAVYILGGKETLSLTVSHGNNTFLYSYDEKVGSLFKEQEATVCIMPYDILVNSKLTTVYALFPESDADTTKLIKFTDHYLLDYDTKEVYALSDGNDITFGISLTPTGRLNGE